MQHKIFLRNVFHLILMTSLLKTVSSSDQTNLCPTSTCNCTLINNTNLNILCNSSILLTQLPTLVPSSLQGNVLELHIRSSIISTKGPLTSLPTNICSYPNLAILDLSFNNINGSINTNQLACLSTKLLQIDLSYNSINNIEKNFFKSNSNLQTINLSHNNLTSMPSIDSDRFLNFPSSITLMNFSYNQIVSVDFWPLFVKTGNTMTIDLSYNLIENYTNTIPISLLQFTETPDPRYFYLNNNRISYFSDLLLQQYGACSTTSFISTAYFIVGISNVLLTNNPLICDCQSYNLITYINDGINDFPEIYNGTALLNQALCTQPISLAGQPYLATDFSPYNDCDNYMLPNTTNIFCSLDPDNTTVTLAPPTYWITSTMTVIQNGSTESNSQNSSPSSMSVSWYIILGVVLGIVVILTIIIIIICYIYRDKCLPKKYRSKFLNNVRIDGVNGNNSYRSFIRPSENLSIDNLQINGIKPRRTSTNGPDQVRQETQTNFQPPRSKPPTSGLLSTRSSQPPIQKTNRQRKLSLPCGTDAATNTINIVKGIPISSLPTKIQAKPSNGYDTSTSELSVASVPLTSSSKRVRILPQVKNGIYDDSSNDTLLNTSAGALVTSQRQRRRSSLWFRKQNQNIVSPLPPRPRSMVTQKTIFDYNGSFDGSLPPIPTLESLTKRPSKSKRTVPVLNISVVPAWVDEENKD